MRQYILLSVILFAGVSATAQSFYSVRRDRNLLFTGGSGIANYYGELVNPGSVGNVKYNVTVGFEYFVTNRISVRPELTWFTISGSDKDANDDRDERNLHFRSNNLELSFLGAISLSPTGQRFYQRSVLNFHAFGGIGFLRFNPKAEYNGEWVALAPLETEGKSYSRIQPVIPFGAGARIKVGPFFNVRIEGGYRLTFTDYLDDVSSTRYPDPTTLKSDLSRALSDRRAEIGTMPPNYLIGKRGNPTTNDGYFIASVAIQYYLPTPVLLQNNSRKLYRNKRRAVYRKR